MKKHLLLFSILLWSSPFGFAQHNHAHYIEMAFKNSPLINDNKSQMAANDLEIERLKAVYTKPQIGVVANLMFSPIISTDNNKNTLIGNAENATNYYGYDLAYSNGGTYQAMVNVTQPLFNDKNFETLREQVSISSQINQNNIKLSQHDLQKIVTDQYILCLQDMKLIANANAMANLLTDQKKIMLKLVENGIYKQSDLTLLSIEHQNLLLQRTTYAANYRRDLLDLNILCGIQDTTLVQLQQLDITLKSESLQSLFLEKYHWDSLSIITQQNIFELKYKPQFNLFANAGLNAVYAPTIPNRLGLSAGLSFSYNIFDGKQKLITRDKTKIRSESVAFYKNNFITQNTVRKTKILTELKSYNDRIELMEQQIKGYEELLNIYKKEIISGQLSILSYTTTLKNMALLQRDYVLMFSQKQSLINTYNYWNW